jgi:adenosylmethionine-8-amino-7-oxononanoate aminotransferase
LFGGLAHEPAYRLRAACRLLPGDLNHVFFAESGSVAVEIAMKMALAVLDQQRRFRRNRFLAFRGGYHGDTLATMTGLRPGGGDARPLRGVMPAQVIADLPATTPSEGCLDALLSRAGSRIAAILVEPLVQGAGGMLFHRRPDAAAAAPAGRQSTSVLLIFDEIFTGFGRTGTLFAMQQAGIEPDIVTLSKALTGGTLPLSSASPAERVFEAFLVGGPGKALMHGPTYMANPWPAQRPTPHWTCSSTWTGEPASRDRGGIEARAGGVSRPIRVADVRRAGRDRVVEFETAVQRGPLCTRFAQLGAWIRPMGRVVYLTPAAGDRPKPPFQPRSPASFAAVWARQN